MLHKWDRFVTAVKLNKGLKETNYEQLYAYLKQHEKHAAQDRLIIERITLTTNDQLAFISSVQPYTQSSQVQPRQYSPSSTPLQSPHLQSLQYLQFTKTSSLDSGYIQTDKILDTLTKQDGRVVVQNVQGRQNQNQRNFARGNGAAGNGGAQNRAGNANAGQGKPIKCYNCNGLGHIARNCTQPKRPQNSDYFKDKMLLMQAQENGAVLDEEELLFLAGEQTNTFDADVDNQPVRDLALNEDNIFQADECDAFDSDVDDEPTTQSIFMANLSSAGPANLQAGPSNASILSEVHDLENAIDPSDNHQVEHEIHDEVQQKNVIESTSADMGNSNVIPYEQYLTVNDVLVVPSSASSIPNDAYVLHDNDTFVPSDPLATELNIYKEQVAIYEQRAKFELTEREQQMDDQMRILIQDRNRIEEKLKRELHSVKSQLNNTIKSQTVIQENVTTLQQNFKQKESKLLNDFSNLRKLKDKLKNKLYSQDQSIQTVYMMLKPKRLYDQDAKTAIGVQNPFYLRKAKMAQPALYDGDENFKMHHVPVSVTSSEEDLELAEINRQKINDPVCVQKRVKIIPPNYSKENFLATFIPRTQLTPEQVFWSKDLLKQRAEDLKANAPPLLVLPPATVYPPNTDPSNASNHKSSKYWSDVFYTITDYALIASRFHDLFTAYNTAMKRIALESENVNLKNKIQNDDYYAMIKHFSKLEMENFNLQLKYQHLKERFGNKKPVTSSDAPTFDSVFVIGQLKEQAQIKENSKCVIIPDGKPKVLTLGRYAIDVEPIPSRNKNNREVHLDYMKHLKESVETLREIVEEAKVERPLDSSLASA
ncbi:retrovirus-related pol polyprotein from transposon TNT 1-94 [Tanacetum coccineum]